MMNIDEVNYELKDTKGGCTRSVKRNVIQEKSFEFAVRVVNLYKHLCNEKKEHVLSKQLLRSGTSVGANVEEALGAQSEKDFIAKLNIAYKEIRETIYWIRLLAKTDFLTQMEAENIFRDADELSKIARSILLTMKDKLNS